jgi:hypothetical protein
MMGFASDQWRGAPLRTSLQFSVHRSYIPAIGDISDTKSNYSILVRIASSLRADMIFGKDKMRMLHYSDHDERVTAQFNRNNEVWTSYSPAK